MNKEPKAKIACSEDQLQELADKVRKTVELEAPQARFIAFFFAGEPEDKTLSCVCAEECRTPDEFAAIENLLNSLEDDGINREKLLGAMIAHGSSVVSRKDL